MDRRRLECFVALSEELHFHRAAQRCHISQPGLSQQLRQLEKQLDVQLMYRSKRQVSLTHAGELFLHQARAILHMMGHAAEITRQADRGLIGNLQLGSTASGLFILLPEILARFRETLPDVHIEVTAMSTAKQEKAIRAGQIHVGLLHPPLDDRSLTTIPLAALPFDVALSTSNPLCAAPRLTMRTLAEENFIMFPREVGPQVYDQIIALCQHEGFSPRNIIEASPAQSIVAMAACNLGIGFIASRVQHYQRPLVTYRKLHGPAPRLTLGLAHSGGRVLPIVEQFIRTAQSVAKGAE